MKVTIKITAEPKKRGQSDVTINLEFDPPVKTDTRSTAATTAALKVVELYSEKVHPNFSIPHELIDSSAKSEALLIFQDSPALSGNEELTINLDPLGKKLTTASLVAARLFELYMASVKSQLVKPPTAKFGPSLVPR